MKVVKIGDIADLVRGVSYKKEDARNEPAENYVSLLRANNIVNGSFSFDELVYVPLSSVNAEQFLEEGDIMITMSSGSKAHVGKVALSNTKLGCVFGAFCAKIKVSNAVLPKYLYYTMLAGEFRKHIENQSKGTNINNLKRDYILGFSFNLPPLEEQRRIVARIEELFSELDAAVATLERTKEQLAVYRQAVLKEAFSGTFTRHKNLDVNLEWEIHSDLPEIPTTWKYISLSKLGELARGKSKHRPRNDKKLFEDGKYPFIQTGDVKNCGKYVKTYSKLYGEFGLQQSKLWPRGTLCITIAANIAETGFLDIDACFPDSIVGFTPSDIVDSEYVRYFIEASKIRLWAFAPATAQRNINLTTLENLVIPYCSLDEQKCVVSEIESRLSVCDKIEETVNTALQEAEAMRQSILKQAFAGEL